MASITTDASPLIRAACYCRISSDPDDKREGVTRQREDTADICAINGWVPTDVPYVDNDRSASNGGERPEWDRLLGDVKAGKIDAVVVWNQDRGWRKMSELESLRPVFEPRGVLLATTNIGVIDFRNADDVFRAQVSTALSEMEIAKMKVRMLRAARQKAEQGVPKWTRAFGYLDDTHQLDPVTAPLVQRVYAHVLSGGSICEAARMLNAENAFGLNGKPWTASTLSLFLRAARNAGLRSHTRRDPTTGKEITDIVGVGTWAAIIDENTWRATQSVLNAPGRAPGKKSVRRHLLTGLLYCGKCGYHLSGNYTIQKSITYTCKKCRGVSVAAHVIEPLLGKMLAERLERPDAVELRRAEEADEAEAEALSVETNTLAERLAGLRAALGQGAFTIDDFLGAKAPIEQRLAEIEEQQNDQERVRVFIGLSLGTSKVWEELPLLSSDRLRAIISVLGTVTIEVTGKGGNTFNADRVVPNWR